MFAVGLRGLKDIYKKLDALEDAVNTEEVLDVAGAFVLNQIRTRFLAETGPDAPWEPSKAGLARKAAGKGGGTMFASGDLFHSISLGRAGPLARRIFTEMDYARKHNDGLDGLVRREFMAFNEADEVGVAAIIEQRIKLALR